MNTLSGKKAEQFVEWLHEARWILPPLMKLSEARELFERKVKEKEVLKNEKKN